MNNGGIVPAMFTPEQDAEVLKRYFKGDESILKMVRAFLLNLPVTDAEKEAVQKMFKGTELIRIFRERFTPQLSRSTPIGQVGDLWLGVEQMVFGQHKDTILQAVMYKKAAIDMITSALNRLENPELEGVNLVYSPTMYPDDVLQINLLARNQFIRHVETQLQYIWIIANEEKKKVNKKDGDE